MLTPSFISSPCFAGGGLRWGFFLPSEESEKEGGASWIYMQTIIFSKKFYSQKAIKKAIKAYQKLANFELKEEKKCFKILLKNIDKGVKDIIEDEFSNYVLAEMKG